VRLLPQRRRRHGLGDDHRRHELIVPDSRSPKKEPAGSFFYRGFSLIELVVIILIIGVISIFVAPRILDSVAQTRGFYDQLLSQVQYARKVAVAQRRAVCVHIGAAQSSLFYSNALGNACPATTGVAAPTGGAPFTLAVPAGVSPLNPVTFQLDGLGRPRTEAGVLTDVQLVVNVAGDGSYQFRVENETGYVR
jgi:MSHA pilin protein MshC